MTDIATRSEQPRVPRELAVRRPAQVATRRPAQVARIPRPAPPVQSGRWPLAFVLFGLPILFVIVAGLGFITAR